MHYSCRKCNKEKGRVIASMLVMFCTPQLKVPLWQGDTLWLAQCKKSLYEAFRQTPSRQKPALIAGKLFCNRAHSSPLFFLREKVSSTSLCNKAIEPFISPEWLQAPLHYRNVSCSWDGGGGNGTTANIEATGGPATQAAASLTAAGSQSFLLHYHRHKSQHDWRHRPRFPFPAPPWLQRVLTPRTRPPPRGATPPSPPHCDWRAGMGISGREEQRVQR